MTALLWAADMGHLDVMQALMAAGADLSARDESGLTPLLWAADRGHVDCVRALLSCDIDVNATDLVYSPLFLGYILHTDTDLCSMSMLLTELVQCAAPRGQCGQLRDRAGTRGGSRRSSSS